MTNTAWENSVLAYNQPSSMPSMVHRVWRPQLHQRNGTGRTHGTHQQSGQWFWFVFFSDRRSLRMFVTWTPKGYPLDIKYLWLHMCFRCHFCRAVLFIKRMSQVTKHYSSSLSLFWLQYLFPWDSPWKNSNTTLHSFLFFACVIKNLIIQVLGDKTPNNMTSLFNSAHAEVGN